MTGPRTTTTSRSRTSRDAGWPRPGCPRVWPGWPGCMRCSVSISIPTRRRPGGDQVAVGIETDRGPWVRALVAAGYRVFAVNPLQAARFRQRHSVSGAKSDAADAHTLADMVRTDSHQLRPVAGDSELAEAIKVVARAHKTLIWERTRHVQRLRQRVAGVLPRRAGGLRGPDRPRCARAAGQGSRPRRRRPG